MKLQNECPICNSTDIYVNYNHTDEFEKTWAVYKCNRCSHGFVNPIPSFADLDNYYNANYKAYKESFAQNNNDEDTIREASTHGEFRHVPISPGIKILEVGSGGGYFLRIASKLGALVEGIEPSKHGYELAKSQNLNVFHGTLDSYYIENNAKKFDVICSNHVLEHIPDPIEAVNIMSELLSKDGVINIVIPNADCHGARSLKGRWHSADIPIHIHQFTPKSIEELAKKLKLDTVLLCTKSQKRGVASTIKTWLRCKLFIPRTISNKIEFINGILAEHITRRQNKNNNGEYIIARFKNGKAI